MRFIFLVLFLVLFGSSNEVNATAIYLCEVEKWSQHFKEMEKTKSRYFTISKPPSRGALAIKEQSNPFGVIFRANDALNYQSKENLNEVFISFSKQFVEVYYGSQFGAICQGSLWKPAQVRYWSTMEASSGALYWA